MRRTGALAAGALLLLALGVAGCKPSSLTPFGIGTQEPDTAGTGVNGLWEGTTSTGGEIRFQVGDDVVTTLLFSHVDANCTLSFESPSSSTTTIVDDLFTLEVALTQGRFVVEGRFTSSTTSAGSYFFEALAATSSCPTSGSGTFDATKTP